VVCPLLRGSSPTRGVAPKQHRGLRRAFTPAFRAGSLYPLIPWRVGAEQSGAAKDGFGRRDAARPARAEPLGHLGQGIEAHARGDWAAANAQFRTFLESLFDEIARVCAGDAKTAGLTSENRRRLLAEMGFLAEDRNEWTQDGKNYINGLFKMLHTEGSHPGLSDEDHSTFRLHVVLVTARTFLRRLFYQQ
jgi:hypothetical protein